MKEKQSSKLKVEIDPKWSAEPAKEGQVAESENVFKQILKANPENESDKEEPKVKISKQSEQIQEPEHLSVSSNSILDPNDIGKPKAKVKSRLRTPTKQNPRLKRSL